MRPMFRLLGLLVLVLALGEWLLSTRPAPAATDAAPQVSTASAADASAAVDAVDAVDADSAVEQDVPAGIELVTIELPAAPPLADATAAAVTRPVKAGPASASSSSSKAAAREATTTAERVADAAPLDEVPDETLDEAFDKTNDEAFDEAFDEALEPPAEAVAEAVDAPAPSPETTRAQLAALRARAEGRAYGAWASEVSADTASSDARGESAPGSPMTVPAAQSPAPSEVTASSSSVQPKHLAARASESRRQVEAGSALLARAELGELDVHRIAWPQTAVERARLDGWFHSCVGMRNALLSGSGHITALEGDGPLDRYSSILRRIDGTASVAEAGRLAKLRSQGLGMPVRLFPRRFDAALLGLLDAEGALGTGARVRYRYDGGFFVEIDGVRRTLAAAPRC